MKKSGFKSGKNWNGNAAGRPKGSKTKHKATLIKEAFFQAFEDIGGVEALAEWARRGKNRKEFYKILASFLPKDIDLAVTDETWDKYKDIPVVKLQEELYALFNGNRKRSRDIQSSARTKTSKPA